MGTRDSAGRKWSQVHNQLNLTLNLSIPGGYKGLLRSSAAGKAPAPKPRNRHKMKPYTLVGILLILVAVAAFTYRGIRITTGAKVVDVGPLHMTAEKTRTLPLTPVVGGIALVSGIALLVAGLKKS
jgi:hypothetical protein